MKRIAGYGALFNVETYAVGNFSEKIARGAFQKSINRIKGSGADKINFTGAFLDAVHFNDP